MEKNSILIQRNNNNNNARKNNDSNNNNDRIQEGANQAAPALYGQQAELPEGTEREGEQTETDGQIDRREHD